MWCSLSSWIGDTESFGDSGYLTSFASSGSAWHYSLRVHDVLPMSGDVRQLGVEIRFGLELPPSWILTLLLLFRAASKRILFNGAKCGLNFADFYCFGHWIISI